MLGVNENGVYPDENNKINFIVVTVVRFKKNKLGVIA
jgi:hypothetical protein